MCAETDTACRAAHASQFVAKLAIHRLNVGFGRPRVRVQLAAGRSARRRDHAIARWSLLWLIGTVSFELKFASAQRVRPRRAAPLGVAPR
jgi:hypothetical protein